MTNLFNLSYKMSFIKSKSNKVVGQWKTWNGDYGGSGKSSCGEATTQSSIDVSFVVTPSATLSPPFQSFTKIPSLHHCIAASLRHTWYYIILLWYYYQITPSRQTGLRGHIVLNDVLVRIRCDHHAPHFNNIVITMLLSVVEPALIRPATETQTCSLNPRPALLSAGFILSWQSGGGN